MRNDEAANTTDVSDCMLVVDDDDTWRARLARALEKRGYRVLTAANYDEAMAHVERSAPSRAVVDLRMPGRSGLDLVEQIRRCTPNARIVVLTGYGSIPTAVSAVRLGAHNYLQKPADVTEILSAFESAPQRAALEIEAPTLERAKWEHISRVLADSGGRISEAARRLGLHRRTLQRMLHKNPPRT